MQKYQILDPVKAAQDIIRQLNIRKPKEIVVELIAETRGATVVESVLTSAEGRLVRRGKRGKITVPSNEKNVGRKRFSIGHELGHFELHSHLTSYVACNKVDMADFYGYKKREKEANEFSAELLMPSTLFSPLVIKKKPNMKLIQDLSDKFNTSITATACRYIKITNEPCALVYSVNGQVEWFIKNDFPFFLKKKGDFIDEYSFAYDAFNGNGDNPSGAKVSASSWAISDDSRLDNIEIMESTLFLEYYNATITLLWQP
ncbi:MAG: ImmA/IrrE family metallo-endopeptidase [Desulfobulbus sp.]